MVFGGLGAGELGVFLIVFWKFYLFYFPSFHVLISGAVLFDGFSKGLHFIKAKSNQESIKPYAPEM